MRIFFLCAALCIISTKSFSQKLNEYKAINGITYKIADTVFLAKGSGGNGEFLYLRLGGFAAAMTYSAYKGYDQFNMNRSYQNTFVIVKKIKLQGFKDQKKTVFTVITTGDNRCELIIDDAIQACEVIPCQDNNQPINQFSVADEILKLKKLLDAGALTQAEFDAQKKKLLNN